MAVGGAERRELDVERAEAAVIVNAYTVARSLGIGYATPSKVISAMIDNPFMFGVAIPHVKDEAQIKAQLREWEALARELGYDPSSLKLEGPTTEVEKALSLVRRLIMSGRPIVIIYVSHPRTLLGRTTYVERLFGAPLEEFSGRRGYRVPWVALLRRMLNA